MEEKIYKSLIITKAQNTIFIPQRSIFIIIQTVWRKVVAIIKIEGNFYYYRKVSGER